MITTTSTCRWHQYLSRDLLQRVREVARTIALNNDSLDMKTWVIFNKVITFLTGMRPKHVQLAGLGPKTRDTERETPTLCLRGVDQT